MRVKYFASQQWQESACEHVVKCAAFILALSVFGLFSSCFWSFNHFFGLFRLKKYRLSIVKKTAWKLNEINSNNKIPPYANHIWWITIDSMWSSMCSNFNWRRFRLLPQALFLSFAHSRTATGIISYSESGNTGKCNRTGLEWARIRARTPAWYYI